MMGAYGDGVWGDCSSQMGYRRASGYLSQRGVGGGWEKASCSLWIFNVWFLPVDVCYFPSDWFLSTCCGNFSRLKHQIQWDHLISKCITVILSILKTLLTSSLSETEACYNYSLMHVTSFHFHKKYSRLIIGLPLAPAQKITIILCYFPFLLDFIFSSVLPRMDCWMVVRWRSCYFYSSIPVLPQTTQL